MKPAKKKTSPKTNKAVKKAPANKAIKKKPDAKYKELMATAKQLSIPIEIMQKHVYNFGRPSEYKPEMCSQLIVIMASGRTFTDACTILGISYVTAYAWMTEPTEEKPNDNFKPDFLKAHKIGQQLSDLWWNEIGKKNLNNKNFNNTLYMMFRQNLHGWTRRLEGKMELEKTEKFITENKTVHEHIIRIQGEEELAEIARILEESGALESAISTIAESETH